MQGRLTPRGARSAVELTSNDAGAVLRSAGLLTQARGGTLDVQLEPVAAAGSYDVILSIVSTRIQDAPAMAALLNAISLVGLLDEMAGQGIFFSSIDSRMRITPTEVKILSGSAVGPSMGLSFDGTVNTVAGDAEPARRYFPDLPAECGRQRLYQKGRGGHRVQLFPYGAFGRPEGLGEPAVGPRAAVSCATFCVLRPPTVSDGPNAQPRKPDEPKRTYGAPKSDR